MEQLLDEIKNCEICLPFLTNGVNPVLSVNQKSKITVIGQAPGSIVHQTGIPWDDKSGERLREWLGVTKELFYNPDNFALIPMSFCYPGRGKTGDLPPRKECAPTWHQKIMNLLPKEGLILLVGSYAQSYYLENKAEKILTKTVQNFENYLPSYFPLPHPSPRNNIWLKKNTWFEDQVLPALKNEIKGRIQQWSA